LFVAIVCDDRAIRVTIDAEPEPLAIDSRKTAALAACRRFGANGRDYRLGPALPPFPCGISVGCRAAGGRLRPGGQQKRQFAGI
jgi:hypothetical protein